LKSAKQYILVIFLLPLLNFNNVAAQADTLIFRETKKQRVVSPIKATMLAAAFPGMGQIYNRKYWKIPIVYAGFGALGYSIVFNTQNFNTYLSGYQDLTDDIAETNSYADLLKNTPYTPEQIDKALGSDEYDPQIAAWIEDQLKNAVYYYRRYRDLSYIGVALWYIITIVDANVDASLADFDVGDNLSINIEPVALHTMGSSGFGMGIRLTF
jgi:hypothetical protein